MSGGPHPPATVGVRNSISKLPRNSFGTRETSREERKKLPAKPRTEYVMGTILCARVHLRARRAGKMTDEGEW